MKATLVRLVTLGGFVRTHTHKRARLYNWSGRSGKECVNGRLPQQPMAAHRMRDIRCNNKGSVSPHQPATPHTHARTRARPPPPASAWRHLQPQISTSPPERRKRHSEHERKKEGGKEKKKTRIHPPRPRGLKRSRITTTSEPLDFACYYSAPPLFGLLVAG